MKHVWYLAVNRFGVYMSVVDDYILKLDERVIGPPCTYERCCEDADRLNEVAAVMEE